jgi:hypothetical protein
MKDEGGWMKGGCSRPDSSGRTERTHVLAHYT